MSTKIVCYLGKDPETGAEIYGSGDATTLPGCDRVAVLHGSFIPKEHRGKGYGNAAHVYRLRELKRLGYDLVVCTVNSANTAELRILKKNRWRFFASFTSGKTGDILYMYGRRLE